jgi:hypothetical protein
MEKPGGPEPDVEKETAAGACNTDGQSISETMTTLPSPENDNGE